MSNVSAITFLDQHTGTFQGDDDVQFAPDQHALVTNGFFIAEVPCFANINNLRNKYKFICRDLALWS